MCNWPIIDTRTIYGRPVLRVADINRRMTRLPSETPPTGTVNKNGMETIVEERICFQIVVEQSLGGLSKVSYKKKGKPRPINGGLRYST